MGEEILGTIPLRATIIIRSQYDPPKNEYLSDTRVNPLFFFLLHADPFPSISIPMDSFLDSYEPDFSDSESNMQSKRRYLEIKSSAPKRVVNRVVVAVRPESILVEELQILIGAPWFSVECSNGSSVGSMFYFEDDLILCVEDPSVRFSVMNLVDDFKHIVVIGSQMYRDNKCITLSTDPNQTTAPHDLAVDGIQGFLLTEAIKARKQGSVILNLHRSIRVELDGLWMLWETLTASALSGFPKMDLTGVADRFRRVCPLNKKVPLYS